MSSKVAWLGGKGVRVRVLWPLRVVECRGTQNGRKSEHFMCKKVFLACRKQVFIYSAKVKLIP